MNENLVYVTKYCTISFSLLGEVQKINRTGISQADVQPVGKSTWIYERGNQFCHCDIFMAYLVYYLYVWCYAIDIMPNKGCGCLKKTMCCLVLVCILQYIRL